MVNNLCRLRVTPKKTDRIKLSRNTPGFFCISKRVGGRSKRGTYDGDGCMDGRTGDVGVGLGSVIRCVIAQVDMIFLFFFLRQSVP